MSARTDWLKQRQAGIGASESAAILGLSPYSTSLDVYLGKVGDVVDQPLNDALEWGQRLEPAVAGAAIDRFGWALTSPGLMRHREHTWILATPDRENQHGELLEIKTTSRSEGWGEPETDEIPTHIWVQVQHQLAVVNSHRPIDLAWVCVLIGGRDFRRYRIPRDPEFLGTVYDALRSFWDCVESRTPPEPDWEHPRIAESIIRTQRLRPGESVELGSDELSLADEYLRIGDEIRDLRNQQDTCKAKLIHAMGQAEIGSLPDGRSVRRRTVERAAYTAKASKYVDFRILKGRDS